jgi:hypothetical protein
LLHTLKKFAHVSYSVPTTQIIYRISELDLILVTMELDEVGVSSVGVGKKQTLDKLPDYVSSSDEDSNIAPSTRKRRKKNGQTVEKRKII